MNMVGLLVLVIWVVVGLLTLFVKELITLSGPAWVSYWLPVSCIDVMPMQSVCYTCLSRNMVYVLPFH